MTQDRTENSRAPPMRHHGFKMVRRVSDTYKMCDCFILSCSKNVLIYRNIHFSKIYPRILKLQQKFTLFWIFPRIIAYLYKKQIKMYMLVLRWINSYLNHVMNIDYSKIDEDFFFSIMSEDEDS